MFTVNPHGKNNIEILYDETSNLFNKTIKIGGNEESTKLISLLFSYGILVAAYFPKSKHIYISKGYSKTTSIHVNKFIKSKEHIAVIEVSKEELFLI